MLGRTELVAEAAVKSARRASAHREVATHEHDLAAIDPARAVDLGARDDLGEAARLVVGGLTPKCAEFAERPGVGERLDALPHSQLPERVLAVDSLGTTHAS